VGLGPQATTYEAIPRGEVTIRRGDPVRATDGEIGRVAGLVIGTPTGEVTHVLLEEGHLWGKRTSPSLSARSRGSQASWR